MSAQPILIVGSVAFDTIHNNLGTHNKILGGSATYASLAASHLSNVRIVGVVGNDYPASARELLSAHKIDLTGLEVADGLTFHWEGRYSDDLSSRTSIATDLNVFANFHPKVPTAFRSTPFVMLGNIDPALQLEVLKQIDKPKLVIADTMNFWISGKRPNLERLLKEVDLLVINEEEARELTGAGSIMKVAKTLLDLGPRTIVIKRGEYGAMLFDGGEVFSAPAYPIEDVVDPTGAGDTFAGGLLGYLAKQGTVTHAGLRNAVIYGSVLASYCVEGMGVTRLAEVNEQQIRSRYSQFMRLAHFATPGELQQLALEAR